MFVWLVAFVVVLLLVLFAVAARSAPADPSGDLALVNGKVYPTPQAVPILNAVVLIHDGKIVAVGKDADVRSQVGLHHRMRRPCHRCRLLEQPCALHRRRLARRRHGSRGQARRAHADHAHQVGRHHRLRHWLVPAGHARAAPARGERRDRRAEDLHHRRSDLSRKWNSGLHTPRSCAAH